MKRSSGKMDLTQGSIFKLILLFALPICLGNMLQQLYSTVDTLVISNFCGTTSLAAIGTSSQPVEILLCLFMGLGSGVSILVAQYIGGRDTVRLNSAVRNVSTFLYLCALPMTVIGIVLGPMILRLMQVPEDTLTPAVTYIRILFLGTLATMGYNTNAGILRGMGDSRSTLYFLIVSCIINILLDLLFVAGLGMDVAGAAWATIIAQYASWLASAYYLIRRFPEVGYTLRPQRIERDMLRSILRISLPMGFNNSFYSVGHVVLQLLINTQGATFMAACSVASKVNSLANVAVMSLSSSATTFSGQNLGAGNYERLRKGAWQIPVFSGLLTLITGVAITAAAPRILSIFNPEQEVLKLAVHYMRIVCPLFWTYAVFNAIISFVNGMGKVKYTMVVNILMLWVVRIPVALLIVTCFDGLYVMAAYPISFTVGMIAMICYFLTPSWKRICAAGSARPNAA